MYRSTLDYSLAPPSHSLITSPVHVIIPPHQHSKFEQPSPQPLSNRYHEVQCRKDTKDTESRRCRRRSAYRIPHTLLHKNQSRLQRKQLPLHLLSSSSPFMLLLALIIQATFHSETLGHSLDAHRVAISYPNTAQAKTIDRTLSIAANLGMLSLSALC